jgi:hypothetical protein
MIEHVRQGLTKGSGTLGRIVIADQSLELIRLIHNIRHPLTDEYLNFVNMGRVAPAEHKGSWIGREGQPEVVHQFGDPNLASEAFSKIRQFSIHPFISMGKLYPSEINILYPYQ